MTAAPVVRFPDTADQHEFETVCQGMRELAPVVCVELPDGLTAWVITRYAEGKRALSDPRLIKDPRRLRDPSHGRGGKRYAEDPISAEGKHMNNSDGDEHLRLRRVVAAELSPSAINRRIPEIERVCRDLTTGLRDRDTVDLMDVYARRVPEIVMARVLGIDDDMMREAAALSRRTGGREDPASPPMREAYNGLLDIVIDCARNPGDAPDGTVLAALHRARADKTINKRELVSTVMLLIGAGIASAAIGIGYAVLTVLRTGDTLRHLLADDEGTKALVEELLRFHPPFAFSPWRFALDPVTIANVTIPAGAVVFILLAAVNHDPTVIADADALVPHRPERTGHLTFGHGPHFCIGAHLARTEIEVALRVLFDQLPNLALANPGAEPLWQGLLFDRSPTTLFVRPMASRQ